MRDLYWSKSREVDAAYIITLPGNDMSKRYTDHCVETCNNIGMPYKLWHGYDGTGEDIVPPAHLINDSFMRMLKCTEERMTNTLMACTLSHISLWTHCVHIDKPIVICEHDAHWLRPYRVMNAYNSVVYLGCREWLGQTELPAIPIMGTEGPNIMYMYCAHAYAIDPQVAKNLLSEVLYRGIWSIPDRIIQADRFNICHEGIYAVDFKFTEGDTTVVGID